MPSQLRLERRGTQEYGSLTCVSARLTIQLQSLLARIAATDRLIDLIVYRLYGLTEEEVAVVEGLATDVETDKRT